MPGCSMADMLGTAAHGHDDLLTRARDLLRAHPLVDGHNDLPWEAREQTGYDFEALDISGRLTTTQTDLPRLTEGGVGAQFWSVFVPSTLQGDSAVTATLEQVDGVHRMIGSYADRLALARTADEVEAATATGRVAPRRRGRSLHRLLARDPADAPRPRRAVPDADAQRQHALGRLGHRRARRRRPQRVRPRGRARDEPPRDDGRPQPRRRDDDAGRARDHRRTGHLQPLLGAGPVRHPPQRA